MNNQSKIRKLTYIALLTAIAILLVHPLLRVPSPYGGVIHVGDSAIFIASVFFGPFAGAFVGGVGHAIANLIFGPQVFAPFTFIIKGIMGFIIGIIAYRQGVKSFRLWIALVCALAILLVGYFLAGHALFITDRIAAAPAPLAFAISNSIQWLGSVIVAVALLPIVNKILGGREL